MKFRFEPKREDGQKKKNGEKQICKNKFDLTDSWRNINLKMLHIHKITTTIQAPAKIMLQNQSGIGPGPGHTCPFNPAGPWFSCVISSSVSADTVELKLHWLKKKSQIVSYLLWLWIKIIIKIDNKTKRKQDVTHSVQLLSPRVRVRLPMPFTKIDFHISHRWRSRPWWHLPADQEHFRNQTGLHQVQDGLWPWMRSFSCEKYVSHSVWSVFRFQFQKNLRHLVSQLYIRDNCHPFKASLLVWVQLPLWISLSLALRNLSLVEPGKLSPDLLTSCLCFTSTSVVQLCRLEELCGSQTWPPPTPPGSCHCVWDSPTCSS